VRLVAISADTPADGAALKKKLGLAFPVLSDTKLELAAAFGVRQVGADAALPAIFLLDAHGEVRWRSVGQSIVHRPTVEEMLAHAR
jgi:peroxiredoxin